LPAVLLAALGGWCLYRSAVLPTTICTQADFDAFSLKKWGNIQSAGDVRQIQAWFIRHYTIMAEFCIVGVIGWLGLWFQKPGRFRWFPVLAFFWWRICCGSITDATHNVTRRFIFPKCPPERNHPLPPGRIIGGFPASLGYMQGLNDIRGYDSIDPARMVDV